MAMGGIRFKSLGYIPSTLSEIARTRSFLNRPIIKTAGIGIQHKRCLSNTQKLEAIRWVMQNPKPSNPTGYFITLPNVPDESAENNAFLASLEHNAKWPPLQSATPDEFYEGTVKLILEYGASIWELLDLLDEDAKKAANGDPGVPKRTFDNTAYSLLDEEYDVFYALNTLLVKMVTDWPECHPALFNEDLAQVQNTFKRELTERWTEPTWVEAVKQAYENDAGKLKPWQQRYLEWMILQARRCGYLTMKEKKNKKSEIQQEINYSWNSTINLFCVRFLGCLVQDSGVNIPIEHRYLLKNAPPRALALLSKGNDPEKGPWEVSSTKHDSVFAALNYCSAREIRQQLWDSYVSRASFKTQRIDLNNSQNIEELRHNTEGFAKALGFLSTAHHRISSKMAGSPQTVRVFVDELLQRFRPVFLDRLEGAWKIYAEEQEERVISDLQAFDLFYICRREAEHCFNVDTLALMKHFPVEPTFERMLQMSSELFNIEFTDITGDENFGFERCDPSVRIFDVTDKAKNDRVGFLYVDIFSRPSKRLGRGHWVSLHGRPANQFRSLDTLVYVLGGHPQVGPGSLLHHDELSEMLSAFGRALQLLFSQSPCHFLALPMAPYFASDFDANDLMPAFMQFCMYKPRTLELLSSPNVETGKPLGNERATNCAKALQRAIFWDSYRVLFWTDFDLTIHNMHDWRKKFWLDLYKQMYSEYFPTFKELNYQPCSFISVFGYPSWSGLFYRKLWAEMLALDVHRTYETENNTAATADRFKSEWLNQGAMELQSDLFRRFQGREPSMQGICDFYDPKTASEDGRTEQEHPQ